MLKSIIIVLAFLFVATATYAQRANYEWSNENVQTISGTIYDNSRPTSYMITDGGTYYKVHLGPVWFWNENNYSLKMDAVKIKGNVKTQNGESQIYPFTIEQNGSVITLSDDKGVPNWGDSRGYNGRGNYDRGYNGRGNNGRGNNGKGNNWRNR